MPGTWTHGQIICLDARQAVERPVDRALAPESTRRRQAPGLPRGADLHRPTNARGIAADVALGPSQASRLARREQTGPRTDQADPLGSRAGPRLGCYPSDQANTATGIRTRVSAMRGRRPSPLDDSGAESIGTRLAKRPASGSFSGDGYRLLRALGAIERLVARGCAIFAGSSARGCGGIGRRARFRSVSR